MNLRQIRRAALCVALSALCAAYAGWFLTPPVTGQATNPNTLQGAAARAQLKQDGQYAALQAAVKQARDALGCGGARAYTLIVGAGAPGERRLGEGRTNDRR